MMLLAALLFGGVLLNPATGSAAAGSKHIYIVRHGEKIYTGDDVATEFECLSEKGWARAYNLKSVFSVGGAHATPDAIFSADYADETTLAPNCRDRHGFYRTQQTVSALAQAAPGGLGIKIDNSTSFMPLFCGQLVAPASKCSYADVVPPAWVSPNGSCCPYGAVTAAGDASSLGMCCNEAAAGRILEKLAEPGVRTILVAWESVNIGYLARAFGVPEDEATWKFDQDAYDRIYHLEFDEDLHLVRYELDLMQGFGKDSDEDNFLGPLEGCGGVNPPSPSPQARSLQAAFEAITARIVSAD